jgi:hypothetical protein
LGLDHESQLLGEQSKLAVLIFRAPPGRLHLDAFSLGKSGPRLYIKVDAPRSLEFADD